MKRARIYYDDVLAGILTETNDGDFIFKYKDDYIVNYPNQFISFSMPVCNKVFIDKMLFSFFEGLIPENWWFETDPRNEKIDLNDRMELLITYCKNCIGAVSVIPIIENNEE